MANPNKQDANQNQHNHKSMAAGAGTGAHSQERQNMDSPENVGGERPNQSNTGSVKNQTDESIKLSDAHEQPARNNY